MKAIPHATPLLDEEAEERAKGQQEALAALTEDQRADGYAVRLWPSPESLQTFTREVLEVVRREDYAVPWLLKVLEDLTRLDADHRIITRLGPVKTRITKMLAEGGYGVPVIATIVEPHAKPGRQRRQARNTVKRRLGSKTEELLFPSVQVDPSAPNAAALKAELQEAAMFVAGVGANMLILSPPNPKRAR